MSVYLLIDWLIDALIYQLSMWNHRINVLNLDPLVFVFSLILSWGFLLCKKLFFYSLFIVKNLDPFSSFYTLFFVIDSNQGNHDARSRYQLNLGWLMGNTLHIQNYLLQVYESGRLSVLRRHKYRTDHSILFYIYQTKITETGQAVLV